MAVMSITNEEDFREEVLNSDLPVLVDFYAEWCHPCTAILPVLNEVANERNTKLVKIDVEGPETFALAQEHNIKSIPAVFYYNKGVKVAFVVGNVNKSAIEQMIP